MQIAVLGPLEVHDGTRKIDIAGARLQTLLTALAVAAPRPVGAGVLVGEVWGDNPPADEANALQSLISRLRRALGDASVVRQSAAGYHLQIDADDVDVHRFERLARSGRAALGEGATVRAGAELTAALALWRGDSSDPRVTEIYLGARADLLEARIRLGESAEVVAELEGLTSSYPLREGFAGLLVQALHGAGRQAEALAAYERFRVQIAGELGVDPSPELRAIHLEVLRADATRAPRRDNLRAALTTFVGRDEQVTQIANLLDEARLITIVGPGGAGKTRLAVESGSRLAARFPDGVWLAELAPVTDPGDVPQTVLGSLGLRESTLLDLSTAPGARDVMTRLLESLADRSALLIVDNCEHLLDAAAELADQLLARCPGMRVVATSREPLGIFGESLLVVPPLGQPSQKASVADALTFPAVRLFADRAASVRTDFTIDESSVAAVIEIVRRLDGLPLAIELAAARLRTLPVEQIAARLSDRFRLLTGGSRTAMPRHRTLRAVVEWSWELLGEDERLLAEQLAVFSGGISPEAAASVCDVEDVDELLSALVDKSLLQPLPAMAGQPRYRMLETIREFGIDRMATRDEVARIRLAHARHFAALVRESVPHLHAAEQLQWLDLLAAERDNIQAGLKYLGDEGLAQEAVDIVNDLGWYWMAVGRHGEGAVWASFALAVPGALECESAIVTEAFQAINAIASDSRELDGIENGVVLIEERMQALMDISARLADIPEDRHPMFALLRPVLAMFADDDERLEQMVEESLRHPDPWTVAMVRSFRAAVAENRGDTAGMREHAGRSYAEFRDLGERWGQANSLRVLARVHAMDGDLVAAAAEYREALRLIGELGADEDEVMLRLYLADVLMRQGDELGARGQVQLVNQLVDEGRTGSIEAILTQLVQADIARISGDIDEARRLRDICMGRLRGMPVVHPAQGHGLALLLTVAAHIDLEAGELDAAREHLVEAYEVALGTKDMPVVANTGVALARLAAELERYADAAQLLGAAASLRGSDDSTQPDVAQLTGLLSAKSATFAEDYARGRALSSSEARDRLAP